MKRNLSFEIDAEETLCGACRFVEFDGSACRLYLKPNGFYVRLDADDDNPPHRHERCLAAEKTITDADALRNNMAADIAVLRAELDVL